MSDHWQHRAVCAGFPDPDMFFKQHRAALVAQLCANCPVLAQCNEFGTSAYRGVWAGKTVSAKSTGKSLVDPYIEEHGTRSAVERHYRCDEDLCGPCRLFNEKANQGRYTDVRVSA